jgi:hypothetical protein
MRPLLALLRLEAPLLRAPPMCSEALLASSRGGIYFSFFSEEYCMTEAWKKKKILEISAK